MGKYAWGMSDVIFDWLLSRAGVQMILRYVFKFLVLRVLALDFIVRQMTLDHLYDLGLDAIRRADRSRKSSEEQSPSDHSTMSSQMPSRRSQSESSEALTGHAQNTFAESASSQSAPNLD